MVVALVSCRSPLKFFRTSGINSKVWFSFRICRGWLVWIVRVFRSTGSGGIQKVGGMKTGIDLKSHVDQKWYEQRMKYQITVGGQKVESRKVKISFAVMPGYQ